MKYLLMIIAAAAFIGSAKATSGPNDCCSGSCCPSACCAMTKGAL